MAKLYGATVIIEVDGHEFSVPMEEARKLRYELNKFFDDNFKENEMANIFSGMFASAKTQKIKND